MIVLSVPKRRFSFPVGIHVSDKRQLRFIIERAEKIISAVRGQAEQPNVQPLLVGAALFRLVENDAA